MSQAADVPQWLQTGGVTVVIGLFVWWVWHNTAVAIPDMRHEQRAHVELIIAGHGQQVDKIVEHFRAEAKEAREHCTSENNRLWEMVNKRKVVA